MNEQELEAIRQKKLAELQEQQAVAQQHAQQEASAKHQVETVLKQILTPDAWEQWNNLKYRDTISRTGNAHRVAILLIQAVQTGQVQGKINKEQLKKFLSIVQEKTHREINIKGLSDKFRTPKKD
jgi:programmed cell death protein 5